MDKDLLSNDARKLTGSMFTTVQVRPVGCGTLLLWLQLLMAAHVAHRALPCPSMCKPTHLITMLQNVIWVF